MVNGHGPVKNIGCIHLYNIENAIQFTIYLNFGFTYMNCIPIAALLYHLSYNPSN